MSIQIFVDEVDQDLALFLWCDNGVGYLRRRNPRKRPYNLYLHRVVMERIIGRLMEPGETVDHADGNRQNNRRSNLRVASQSQQKMNMAKKLTYSGRPTHSKFKGVTWDKARSKWMAFASHGPRFKFLGHFTNETEAARAYNCYASKYYREFARLNPC